MTIEFTWGSLKSWIFPFGSPPYLYFQGFRARDMGPIEIHCNGHIPTINVNMKQIVGRLLDFLEYHFVSEPESLTKTYWPRQMISMLSKAHCWACGHICRYMRMEWRGRLFPEEGLRWNSWNSRGFNVVASALNGLKLMLWCIKVWCFCVV